MRLLICKLCLEGEPFACPFKFRRSYMFMHLEKTHGLEPARVIFTKSEPTAPGGPALWMAGRDTRPMFEEIEVPLPGTRRSSERPEPIPGAREKFAAREDAKWAGIARDRSAGAAARAGYPDWRGATADTYGPMH